MAAVIPIIESVTDNRDGTFTALFGYENTYAATQLIPVSSSNEFSPAPADRGQPTSFLAGRQIDVFSITWSGSDLMWTLDGTTVTANASQALFTIEDTKAIVVADSEYYICTKMTAIVWIKGPGVANGDSLIVMAAADPYENILNTDSSIKLELLRVGNDMRLMYFSSRSTLVNRTVGVDLRDGNWHFLSYECLDDGVMRYSVDGINLPPSLDTDEEGRSFSQARSTKVRPGGGSLWTPYLYKAEQSVSLYQLRFGLGFNLGLPWIRRLMEIDKIKLGI